MIYTRSVKGIIVERLSSTTNPGSDWEENPKGIGSIGMARGLWDKNWNARPIADLVADGTIILSDYQKIEGGEILLKTDIELICEGIIDKPIGYKITTADDGTKSLVLMTLAEKLEAGQITTEEYNAEIKKQRAARFVLEVDPIRFDIEEGKATLKDLLALKEMIREELKYIEVQ